MESCDSVFPATQIKILLIDLENCPNQINMLLKDLEQFSQVVICYAQSGAKIPLDWLMPLTEIVNQKRLKIVKMPYAGKNAADFGICFLAGMLMVEQPPNTHFVVMSEDSDLDHAINLLKSYGRTALRIGLKKDESTKVPTSDVKVRSLKDYSQKLLADARLRPSTKTALLNSLRAYYSQDMNAAEQALQRLLAKDIISLDGTDKVMYHEEALSQYMQQA